MHTILIMSAKRLAASAQGRALLQHRKAVIAKIKKYGYHSPYCFGSVARGDAGPNSDIDILVDMDRNQYDPVLLYRLADELEAIVGYPFDVANLDFMRESVRKKVIREATKF